jgi:histidinol-phosphate aminotransferase
LGEAGVPRLTALAAGLPSTVPFVGPEAQERARGGIFRARLGANESGFGPSPAVIAAMEAAAPLMWRYCDPENWDLRAALATHCRLTPGHVTVGEGIDALLGSIVRLWAAPGETVVTSFGAYPTFNYHVAGYGARLVTVPYRNDREDIEALADAARRENARIAYLANPDNPMGTWWGAADIAAFIDALPSSTLLILDEAYGETAPPDTLPALDAAFFDRHPNVLRLRTFSKAYGLAGLRCGYGLGHPAAIRAFDKVRNHFGVTAMSQAAAMAALGDQHWMLSVVGRITAARGTLGAVARSNGFDPLPSATNFVTMDCGRDGPFAKSVLEGLIADGIFVRKPMAPGLDRCIRVSCAPEETLAVFAEALPGVLKRLG